MAGELLWAWITDTPGFIKDKFTKDPYAGMDDEALLSQPDDIHEDDSSELDS